MITVYQEELREPQVIAIWVGNIGSEGELAEYLGKPFESTFGFFLDQDDLPEFSKSFTEPRLHAHYNRPFERTDIRELLVGFSWSSDWIDEAEGLCRRAGFDSAKTVVVFPSLRYRRDLELGGRMAAPILGGFFRKLRSSGKEKDGRLYFVGNVSWPGGARAWEELQSRRIIMQPFPKLIINTSEHEVSCEGDRSVMTLTSWTGRVQLEAWKGFATDKEMSRDYWRFSEEAAGTFCLEVNPPSASVNPSAEELRSRPSEAQARAFQHLLDNQAAIRDAVLEGVFKVYPEWRENHYGQQISSDGGKTYQSGWHLPELFPPGDMPNLKHPHELMRIIQLGTIHVSAEETNGFTRIGFVFGCKWDEEHGIGVVTHKGKVIEVGQADCVY